MKRIDVHGKLFEIAIGDKLFPSIIARSNLEREARRVSQRLVERMHAFDRRIGAAGVDIAYEMLKQPT